MRIDHMILVPPLHQSCSLIVACLFWSKTMKCLLLFFVVAAVLLPLEAAPLRKTWYKLAPSAKFVKAPTDIWSNCSKRCNYSSCKKLLLITSNAICSTFIQLHTSNLLCRPGWRPGKNCQCGYHARSTREEPAFNSLGNLQFKYVLGLMHLCF